MTHHEEPPKGNVVFRRYIRLPNGRILDAEEYGYRAWPIRVGGRRK